MFKKLTAAAISGIGLLGLANPAFAADLCPKPQIAGATDFSTLCELTLNGSNIFGNIITIIFVIATLLALIYLIWGGIKWVMSGGDKAKVDGARAAIVASIVGLIIIFLSYFILNVVVGLFIEGFSLQTIKIPTLIDGGSGAAPATDSNGCPASNPWDPNLGQCAL